MTDVGRYGKSNILFSVLHKFTRFIFTGKVFYVELDGEGRAPVLHFGMTGNLLVSPVMHSRSNVSFQRIR